MNEKKTKKYKVTQLDELPVRMLSLIRPEMPENGPFKVGHGIFLKIRIASEG